MARRIERRRPEDEDEEDDGNFTSAAPRGQAKKGPNYLIWIFPAGALILLLGALLMRLGGSGGREWGDPSQNERYIPMVLREFKKAQDIYNRDMADRKTKSFAYASHFSDVAYKYAERWGAPAWEKRYAAADSPASTYRGYYFADIKNSADGKPYDYKTGWGLAAVPAEHGKSGMKTFIADQSGAVYSKDTAGKAPEAWPADLSGWQAE